MGKKNRNPLEYVTFYKLNEERTGYDTFRKQPDEVSTIVPLSCQTTLLRVFVKDDTKFRKAQMAFVQYCKEKLGGKPGDLRGIS